MLFLDKDLLPLDEGVDIDLEFSVPLAFDRAKGFFLMPPFDLNGTATPSLISAPLLLSDVPNSASAKLRKLSETVCVDSSRTFVGLEVILSSPSSGASSESSSLLFALLSSEITVCLSIQSL